MPDRSDDKSERRRLEKRLDEMDRKMDILLVEAGRTMSPYVVIILLVMGVICGIWAEMLMKRYALMEKKGRSMFIALTITSVVAMFLLARKINQVPV